MKKTESIEQSLLEYVLQGAQPEELAKKAATLLGNPVALLDAAHTLAAVSSDYPQDDLQDRIRRNELLEQNGQGCRYFSAEFWADLRKGTPFLAPLLYLRRGRMLCGSIIQGKIAGIVMLPDMGVPFKELDKGIICAVARAWSVLLLRSKGLKGTGSCSDQELLWTLLTKPGQASEALREKSPAYQPFQGGKCFRMLYVEGSTEDLGTVFSEFCAIPEPEGKTNAAAVLCQDSAFEQENLTQAAQRCGAHIGISDPYSDLTQTAKHFLQAKKALRYSRLMKRDCVCAFYNEFRFVSMLDSVPEKESYFDARLIQIKQYDHENQTEYFTTLQCYLLHSQDSVAVTKQLHIHKNTLLYRLNRIKELFDIDLHDCMQLSAMYCGILMQQMANEQEQGDF